VNRTLLYAAFGLAAGAGAAWIFAPQLRKSISSDDARKLLGLAANLVSTLPALSSAAAPAPRRRRQVRAARKTAPVRRSGPRKRAA
jgi:hypothetical protein